MTRFAPFTARRPSPRASYLTALALVAPMSLAAFVLLRGVISAQAGSAAVINVSGRQRMLSQRTTLFALRLVGARTPNDRADRQAMADAHAGLLRGDPKLGLPGQPSAALRALYFGDPTHLDARVRAHLARVQALLDTPDAVLSPSLPAVQGLLRDAPTEWLGALNAAVTAYQTEAEARVARLHRLEAGVLAATLLILVLEALLIFGPMERERRRRSQQLTHNALHDALTGLPNRALFQDRLGQAIARRGRDPQVQFAVLFLDCDRFKLVNDSLGHPVGDALLVALAARLQGCVRAVDTVARLGDDEFTVLLTDLSGLHDAVVVAERIGRALAAPLDAAGQRLHATVSIGRLSSEEGDSRPEEVLRDADLAMYRAKALGRARFKLFTPDLHGAAGRGEMSVHDQPVVASPDGTTTGFGALRRWTHPQHGPVSPAECIPVAEESGLIVELDRFVLRAACAQMRAWQAQFAWAPPLTLSVNISARHLERPDLPEAVAAALRDSGLSAAQLKLELTESVLARDLAAVGASLTALRALGVQVHIDDFGTGSSGLAYLHRCLVDAIKIDRSFIGGLTRSDEGGQLVKTIIAVAHSLNLAVVAEGVEAGEQLRHLQLLGCDSSQGHLLSKPLAPDAATAFLAAQAEVGVG